MFRKLALALMGAAALMGAPAWAQEFPARTVEVIFPWTPGTSMSVTQVIADSMSDKLGVPMTVISTPGAAGTKALETLQSRPADGYSIFDAYVAPLVLQPVLGNGGWSYSDFAPLHSNLSAPFSIALRKGDDRWANFDEMMAWGREHPGELRYSAGARNTLPHMAIAKVLQEYGVVARNIPYAGDAEARRDLSSGILDFAFVNVGAYQRAPEDFNVLLVLSELDTAKEAFGGAPNITELDINLELSGLAPMGWSWWVVRKDTPPEELAVLREAMSATMKDPEVREAISRLGVVPLEWDYDEYEAIVGPVFEQLKSMGDALAWEEEQMDAL
ncbi:Bug family tripartite tricarboxylate transporter substrate binding protein [Salipiger abyssi]|uniref:Bug family tripartite tricarboxylate transporter substrate binding protein n=1 Tax=Salipiger abyssi TaxID=1250539 RepID=UPI001A909EFA|nr:tripartite tricarboxylate transporter substrate-binding protein [Salipiger abyssi]MBN9888687.1 tripartite tricarboxylate transporter substrate binding protein [Salipiger abyssi]